MSLQQFIKCAFALLSFSLLLVLSQSASVTISLSNNNVQLGRSFQISVAFSPVSSTVPTGERLRSLKCGYQDGTGPFIAFAEYNTGSSSLQLVTAGFPQLYAGRLLIASAKTIRISNVKFDDERMKYYCILKYSNRSSWWFLNKERSLNSSKQSLSTVYASPWFSKTLLPDISNVLDKETLILKCTVISRPVSDVSWSFDKNINGLQSKKVIPYANYYASVTSTLQISNISRSLNGTRINCIATPTYGTSISMSTTMVVSCNYSCETWNGGCSYVCFESSTSIQNPCSSHQALTASVTKSRQTDTCMIVNPCGSSKRIIYEPNSANNCPCLTGYYGKSCNVHLRECSANSCGTKGKCLNDQETCGCIDGFTGRHCSTNIDECHNNAKCMNNATCIDGINSYTCRCSDGFTGRHCSINIDDCNNDTKCMHNATCIDGINSYTCQCRGGFNGMHCETIDQCFQHKCKNGICIDDKVSYKCQCYIGYTGGFCDADIDECKLQSENVCNNGSCISGNNTFHCKCLDLYTGDRCDNYQSPCRSNPCGNRGTCLIKPGVGFVCKCDDGFTGTRCEKKFKPCDVKPCKNKATCENVDEDGRLIFKCNCIKGYGGNTCQFFYGNTAVRVTLKTKKTKPFNETAFRNAIAKSMNDFCSKSPERCPQIVADRNMTNHERFRRSPTKPYVYKSSDVKFIQGYPKTKPDGRIVIRFFVTFETSSSFPGKPGNSTATPKNLAVVNPTTVKTALDDDVDTSSYGFNIQSVEVVHTSSESKTKKSNGTKTLVIIIAILTIAVVICTIVGAYLFWRRYKRLDPFTKSTLSGSNTSKWTTNRSYNEEKKTKGVGDIKSAKKNNGRAKKENQATPNEYINMVALQEESDQNNPSYVNFDKDIAGNVIRNSHYANMDTILREKRSIPLYDNMIPDDSDMTQDDSDYLQPVVLHEDDLYLKIIN